MTPPSTGNTIRERSGRKAALHIIKGFYCAAQTGLFFACWLLYYRHAADYGFYFWGHWAVAGLYLVVVSVLSKVYGGFRTTSSRAGELSYSLIIAVTLADGLYYCIFSLLAYRLVDPLPLLALWLGNALLAVLWSFVAVKLTDRLYPPLRTYLIYDNAAAYRSVQGLRRLTWKFDIIREVYVSSEGEIPEELLDGAEAVLLCGLRSSLRNTLLKQCVARGISVYVRPKIGDLLLSGGTQEHLAGLPFLNCQQAAPSLWYSFFKRLLDLVICGLALVVLSPLFALTALLVKLEDGGPVFYRQCRLTTHGQEFYILKFRSMRVDAEKDGVARLSTGDSDPRITRTGRFIRKCRLDELPQLINILRGEMSIVGPRPERPEIAEQYEEIMPEFRLRLQVKAGLTGYAQVYGKYNTDPYDKLEMDLMYIARLSILQDLALMFVTVKILFLSESTEGVAEGQTTATQAQESEQETMVKI